MSELRRQIKELIVNELDLRGKRPDDIDDGAPLFGEGLGLDSLDALQLAASIEERFAVRVPDGQEGRAAFASVDALVAYLAARTKGLTG